MAAEIATFQDGGRRTHAGAGLKTGATPMLPSDFLINSRVALLCKLSPFMGPVGRLTAEA
jgi:hypothetical protein